MGTKKEENASVEGEMKMEEFNVSSTQKEGKIKKRTSALCETDA